jgi:plastocyanin
MMRKVLIILIVLFSVFMAIGCTSNTGNNTQTPETPAERPAVPVSNLTSENSTAVRIVEVLIENYSFNPKSVTVYPEDTVRWTNMDSVNHTVTGSTFDSGQLAKGDTFEYRFTEPGVYDYHCSIHPFMKGTVVVEKA